MSYHPELHGRLRNCLQTILELEAMIRQAPINVSLLSEFSMLKDVMGRLDGIIISEDDVHRIEEATANFLTELKGALEAIKFIYPSRERLQ